MHTTYSRSLIRLFEGGILEKMTNAEYELMINRHSKNATAQEAASSSAATTAKQTADAAAAAASSAAADGGSATSTKSAGLLPTSTMMTGGGGGGGSKKASNAHAAAEAKMKPITLCALQGAFIALAVGAAAAAVVLALERRTLTPLADWMRRLVWPRRCWRVAERRTRLCGQRCYEWLVKWWRDV